VLVLAMTGLLVEVCFVGMALLHDLLANMVPFLALDWMAFLSYGTAVYSLLRGSDGRRTLPLILGLAILFRVTLLFITPPALSSDVYRYIWDGRMMNAGVNPYAHPVDSPLLDRFDSPQRALVNHSWMASPYLPVAQAFFAAVYRLAPDSPLSFQVAAALLDLLTGLLVIDLLHRLGLPRTWALIYLWNPLVIVEFAHGAHLDALMICLVMAAFWLLIARMSASAMSASAMSASRARSALLSAVALAAATLTKGLPALLLPVLARRWGWRRTLAYAGLVIAACLPFALGAGWGLLGPLDGEGLFGALRIYTAYWNFYSGLYHWLEAGLSTCWTSGTAPSAAAGWAPTLIARLTALVALCLVVIVVWRRGRRCADNLALLRLAVVPLAAYLLVATTVHPWYVTFVIPLLPFLPPRRGEAARRRRLVVPWLYFSAVVSLTYLTYLDPANPRESDLVRLVEYVPLYVLLIWSVWPASGGVDGPGAD
jgi:alpha-1,6-mannosyltransferase